MIDVLPLNAPADNDGWLGCLDGLDADERLLAMQFGWMADLEMDDDDARRFRFVAGISNQEDQKHVGGEGR